MAITKPTVLVLGAGASLSYGFPLGRELRDQVLGWLARGAGVLQALGHDQTEIRAFRDSMRYSMFGSVDEFLEHFPEFELIGKRAIAAILLPAETEARLFPPGTRQAEDWYDLLVRRLEPDTDAWFQNRLSIVTFNYDRSLEHFFTRVLATRMRLSRDDAYRRFAHVPVVHVHGSLGAYPPSEPGGLDYGVSDEPNAVRTAAERIQIVGGVADTLPTFDEAEALLAKAENIVFLGFGFHPDNVRRLRVFQALKHGYVWGTSRGVDPDVWSQLAKELGFTHTRSEDSIYAFLAKGGAGQFILGE